MCVTWRVSFMCVTWSVSFMCVTWLDSFVSFSEILRQFCIGRHVFHDSLVNSTCFTNVCDLTYLSPSLNSSADSAGAHVTRRVDMCAMTLSYVCHDSFVSVKRLIHVCTWHDASICVPWLFHECGMAHSCEWHDSFVSLSYISRQLCMGLAFSVRGKSQIRCVVFD